MGNYSFGIINKLMSFSVFIFFQKLTIIIHFIPLQNPTSKFAFFFCHSKTVVCSDLGVYNESVVPNQNHRRFAASAWLCRLYQQILLILILLQSVFFVIVLTLDVGLPHKIQFFTYFVKNIVDVSIK